MNNYPNLRRWAAALATLAVFATVIFVTAWSGGGKTAPPPKTGGSKSLAWPMFGGHLDRNMVNLKDRNIPYEFDVQNKQDKQILWSADLGSKAYGGPIVADGKVFIGTNNEKPRDPKDIDPKTKKPIDRGIMMCFE